jgi:phosphoribosylformylglycinamidine cyclo-ligase
LGGVGHTYKDSGVDIETGNKIVRGIKKILRESGSHRGASSHIGAFAAGYDVSRLNILNPILYFSVDGVGTKLKIAFMTNKHDTVGIDLVAMSANDILVSGARPFVFQDYISFSKLDEEVIYDIIRGIVKGCEMATCELTGGETAEMPGFYGDGEYDLAGFMAGAVDRHNAVEGKRIAAGDAIVGIASSGLHSNGYSLARKVLFEELGLTVDDPFENATLGEELLKPTKIYVQSVLKLIKIYPVSAMANITGGGFSDNIPRILPPGVEASIKIDSWPVPPIFDLIRTKGAVSDFEMYRTFNMGIGFVLIVNSSAAKRVVSILEDLGEKAYVIGTVGKQLGFERITLV